ncbi:muts domain V-domain-containing protein [Thelephora terrestris]|uniref:Muts domain V-domain-containing protein n=1 Tax=Thelephora terrestris TaxID=56493 RepID=A0A9P6L5W4_9AGAM|nr:muts domain V-domain-containing protein [Thelephora terrestris]
MRSKALKRTLSTAPASAGESGEDGRSKKKVRWDPKSDDEEVRTVTAASDDFEGTGEERSATSDNEKICLAISCQGGSLGAAYFDSIKCVVRVVEDTLETSHLDSTTMILELVGPDQILTTSKTDDRCIRLLQKHAEDSGGFFQIRPQKDFSVRRGRDRLLSLPLLSEFPIEGPDRTDEDSRTSASVSNAYDFMRRTDPGGDPSVKRRNASIRMANFASFDQSPLCLGAVGALLDHLIRERAVGDLSDEGLDVRGIELLTFDRVMHINLDALHSLQVFDPEDHASLHSDKFKEGLSIYGILNNTRTTLGRNLLREWLLRPSLSLPIIAARHAAVACFVNPDNITTAGDIQGHMSGIKNTPRAFKMLKSGRGKVQDWQGVVKFAFHAAMIRDSLAELVHANHVDVLKKLFGVLDLNMLRDVGTIINETIDWEECINAGRVCVQQHIDEELDNRKHIYAGLDTVLAKVAQQVASTAPDVVKTLNVVYFPQLGFLICVPMLEEWSSRGQINDLDGWTFQFSSEAHVYFKSQQMTDLDTHIGDLHTSIVDRELEIIEELLQRVIVYEEALTQICDLCAELDCLLSFAQAARTYNLNMPDMCEGNVTKIIKGRHPLQELVVDTFVPNDVHIVGGPPTPIVSGEQGDGQEEEAPNVVICTGANACGKSVYLKQTALIQYMAQIGCFVPAESARLGLVDKIFTRVQTRESVSKEQSAFMIDLNQVSFALRNCTEHSLIILDEFGKGTLSTDGAGLFCGVIKHLVNRTSGCPKILAATHFHQVAAEILKSSDSRVSFVHMQVMFSSSSTGKPLAPVSGVDIPVVGSRPGEKITYLYRVVKGFADHSHAARCAELCGLPHTVVERAEHVSALLAAHELEKLLDEDMTEEELRELEEAEAIGRNFLAWNLDDETAMDRPPKEVVAEILGMKNEDQDG